MHTARLAMVWAPFTTQKGKKMSQNLISVTWSETDLAEIDAAINTL
jgi:hypothetical protein